MKKEGRGCYGRFTRLLSPCLTFAGVVGLVAMVIALYVASAALEAAHRAKKKDNKE
ncbi:MAG: hypothetical protein V8Q32_07285 [Anaerotignum faecicola]